MDVCTAGGTDGRKPRRRGGRTDEQMKERTRKDRNKRKDGQNEQRNERANERTNERTRTRTRTKRNETEKVKCSHLPLVAAHANQNVHKSLKARRVSCVSKLGFSVVHDVFSGPLRNLFSAEHQLQLLWSERTKLLHRKHGVKAVWKINTKLKISRRIQQAESEFEA